MGEVARVSGSEGVMPPQSLHDSRLRLRFAYPHPLRDRGAFSETICILYNCIDTKLWMYTKFRYAR